MGTTSDKLTYLNETKQRQKNLINALGGEITNETPFREYEQELIGVLPKVTGEGTNFSLSPTIEYDLEVGYKGDTKQDTLNGYQLIPNLTTQTVRDITFSQDENGIKVNGTIEGTYNSSNVVLFNQNLESGTYLVHGMTGGSNTTYQIVVQEGNTPIKYVTGANTPFTIENTTNIRLILYVYRGYGASFNNLILPCMLEKGSTAHSYEPYCGGIPSPNPNYPQDIQVVTGTQEIEVVGKNIFNITPVLYATASGLTNTINEDGSVTTAGILGGNYASITRTLVLDDILINGQSYTLSQTSYSNLLYMQVLAKNKSTSANSYYACTSTARTFTVDLDTYTYSLNVQGGTTANWGSSSRTITNTYQLECSSTATTYSPYTSQSYTLHLGDEELAKIGNYQDKIYYEGGKWYLRKEIEKIILSGSETFSTNVSIPNVYFYATENGAYDTTRNIKAISNYFVGELSTSSASQFNSYANNTIAIRGGQDLLGIKTDIVSSVNDFKTWLSTHNTTIYVILNTIQTTEITNTTLLQDLNYIKEHIKSYSDTTNISSSGDLSIVISASAIKQLS